MGSSATGPRPGRLLLLYGGIALMLFVAVPAGVYVAADPERLDLDQSVRSAAHGQFARSHLGGNFDSRPSSQRTSRLPSLSKARSEGLGCGFFGWSLSSRPIPGL